MKVKFLRDYHGPETNEFRHLEGASGIIAGAYMMLDNKLSASDVANAIVPANGTLA